MAATSSRHERSLSPSGRFCSSSISSSSSFASSSRTFSSPSSSLFHRSSSPTRVSIYGSSPQSSYSSFRFSIDNTPSYQSNSYAAVNRNRNPFPATAAKKKTCLCSPTSHPGSFRCNYHKNLEAKRQNSCNTASYHPNRLNMRRSAMTNSLVRIGTVEGGEWVKRALATLIRPCAHQQRRRDDFQPRPSRLSVMSKAGDGGDPCGV